MSKSKGNVVTPIGLLEEYGSDAVRYWAAKGGPGVDTAFDSQQMKVGRRLAIKILNASKFVLSKAEPSGPVTHVIDRGMLTRLEELIAVTTKDLDAYDYGAALRNTEEFFWWFCDDHIEHIKRRRAKDDADAASAAASSVLALSAVLRLFAPFLPFVTEEVWSWWQAGSIHRAVWPTSAEIFGVLGGRPDAGAARALDDASKVTSEIRRFRSAEKAAFTRAVTALTIPAAFEQTWAQVSGDVLAANNASEVTVQFGAEFHVEFAAAGPQASADGSALS
jgi:valyl-tRNA synthetase